MKPEELLERQRQEPSKRKVAVEYIRRDPVLIICLFYVFTIVILGIVIGALLIQLATGCS